MILYFSGTGNTLFVAKQLATHTDDKLISINELLKADDHAEIDAMEETAKGPYEGNLVFVLPTYAWRIPKVIEQWIRKTTFINAKNVYFVLTCGADSGNAKKYVKRLCEDKNFNFMGLTSIVMPDNYIIMFKPVTKEESLQIISKAIPQIERTALLIKTGQPLTQGKTNLMGLLGSNLFNTGFNKASVNDKKFMVTGECIECGKCEGICPLNNISLEENGPVWHGKCTQCMGCIGSCPIGIIEYGKNTIGKIKYMCPTDEEIKAYIHK